METANLSSFLDGKEWFDNHRLSMILACRRKAYWHLLGPVMIGSGLAHKVGQAAFFGTCMHAGRAAYKHGWGQMSETDRRDLAFRAIDRTWQALFPQGAEKKIHTVENAVRIFDAYCDHFLSEDDLYRPVDPELGFCIRIAPRPGEPDFEPWYFVGRMDGIDQRMSVGDYVVDELKTSSGGADRRLKSLEINHQPIGYVYAARCIAPDLDIRGFNGEVIFVGVDKLDFPRDYFPVSRADTELWRKQKITLVEDWRRAIKQVEGGQDALGVFYQNTEHCFNYGLCGYFDLCKYGANASTLSEFTLDDWNPLTVRPIEKVQIIEKEETS